MAQSIDMPASALPGPLVRMRLVPMPSYWVGGVRRATSTAWRRCNLAPRVASVRHKWQTRLMRGYAAQVGGPAPGKTPRPCPDLSIYSADQGALVRSTLKSPNQNIVPSNHFHRMHLSKWVGMHFMGTPLVLLVKRQTVGPCWLP